MPQFLFCTQFLERSNLVIYIQPEGRGKSCSGGYLTFLPMTGDENKVYALLFQMTLC